MQDDEFMKTFKASLEEYYPDDDIEEDFKKKIDVYLERAKDFYDVEDK